MTPRILFEMFEVRADCETMMNFRAGLAASAIYNVNRKKNSHAIKPLDFWKRQEDIPLIKDPVSLREQLRAFTLLTGGTVLEEARG